MSRVAVRWAALKRAVQQEAARVLDEYSKARAQVLAQCGQDIGRGPRGYIDLGPGQARGIVSWPRVFIYAGGARPALKVDPGPAACEVAGLTLAEHWPGPLRRWEAALAILIATTAETIVSAWEQAEAKAE